MFTFWILRGATAQDDRSKRYRRPGELTVGKIGLGKEHTTIVREFAKSFLMDRHTERIARKMPGDFLFPPSLSRLSGKGVPTLTKMTVYRMTKKIFETAGIEVQREGGRTLRNMFAVQSLQDGLVLEKTRDRLGLHELKSAQKYVPLPKQTPFTDIMTVRTSL